MTGKHNTSTEHTGPTTTAGAWGLRYPGLVMSKGGKNEVKEFTGMWRPQARRRPGGVHERAGPGRWMDPPGESFSEQTTKLGLIRTARWFVGRTQDFGGYTLFFVSQFDGTLEKYFDDFVLNGKDNLAGDLGPLRRLPDRPECDGARHRGVHRTRSDQDAGLLRRRSEPQHRVRSTRRPTGTRRRRSSSARSPRATATLRTRSTRS